MLVSSISQREPGVTQKELMHNIRVMCSSCVDAERDKQGVKSSTFRDC